MRPVYIELHVSSFLLVPGSLFFNCDYDRDCALNQSRPFKMTTTDMFSGCDWSIITQLQYPAINIAHRQLERAIGEYSVRRAPSLSHETKITLYELADCIFPRVQVQYLSSGTAHNLVPGFIVGTKKWRNIHKRIEWIKEYVRVSTDVFDWVMHFLS